MRQKHSGSYSNEAYPSNSSADDPSLIIIE